MNPGVYDHLSNAEYHAGPGESKSLLDLVARSPVHYLARTTEANDNEPSEPTPAQRIGTAFHALVLEPAEFVKSYCLALRQQDVDTNGAPLVESKDQLLTMIDELNKGRLPKLSTGGTKDELVARIGEALGTPWGAATMVPAQTEDGFAPQNLAGMKAAELKSIIERLNESRPGLLSATGTMEQLAQALRDAGRQVLLWSEVKAEWLRNNSGRQVLTQAEWDQLHRMRDAVKAHPAASALLYGAVPGRAERSVYWFDDSTGLLCRCRPDFWRADGIVVDLKTCDDASPEGFAHSIGKWRYHVQHPFYLDGINTMRAQIDDPRTVPNARAFVFVAVEKTACVVDGVAKGVAVYSLDNESVEAGRAEYQRDLRAIAHCKQTGEWPGYGDKVQSISLSAWRLAKAAA